MKFSGNGAFIMKIKTKLLLGLSIMIILCLVLVGIGWYQLYNMNNNSNNLKHNYDISSLSFQIQREVKDEAISIRNLTSFNDQDLVRKELLLIEKERTTIKRDIQLLEKLVNNTEQSIAVKELKDTNEKFDEYVKEVSNQVKTGNKDEATKIIVNNGYQMQDDFFNTISKITDSNEIKMNTSINGMKNDFKRNMLISSLFSLIGLILGIGYLFKTVWSIAVRLNNMSNIMSEVAKGTSNLTTRIEVKSIDEIDDVGRSFNFMTESLEEQMKREQNLSKLNEEQAWTNSNLAKVTTELSGMHELEPISQTFLSLVVPLVGACQAVFYIIETVKETNEPSYKLLSSYAFKERKHLANQFTLGEGLVGQAALEKTPILLTDVPSDYIQIKSGLGKGTPLNIYVLPVIFKGEVIAVIEFSSFVRFDSKQQELLEELVNNLGIILDSTMGRIQLAKLLEESQVLMEELQTQSEELQSQQEELRATNEELEVQTQALRQSEEKLQFQQEELEQTNSELREKAVTLEIQNKKFEATNREVEKARAELEEKARQLTLTSKYKSEFLANMSHELRTPLNSLLILSKLLSENGEGNLTDKQVEFSRTIYSSGCDLLGIINDILDLAKIESGKMEVNISEINIEDLVNFVEKSFRPVATEKNIDFNIVLKEDVSRYFESDAQRIQQVLQNLLSNAFKFTDNGKVTLEIASVSEAIDDPKISFSIIDTGIGIPKEKQKLIFEAFQQADGTTSRKYGGTGLGLSICRQITSLLGGDIFVKSEEGRGSSFTFIVGNYKELKEDKVNDSHLDETSRSLDFRSHRTFKETIKMEQNQPSDLEPNKSIKRLLIVDDDVNQRTSLMELIGEMNVIIKTVSTGAEAMEELKVSQFDCMLLDLGLTDTTGFELLEKIKSDSINEKLDIFIYTGRDLTSNEEIKLNRHAHTIIIKDSHSPQRLRDELGLYLNSDNLALNVNEIRKTQVKVNGLEGKKILLVDDDVRNVYALSNVLEMNGMTVKFAENGIEGIKMLEKDSDFDIVLMDIMMPEMDGYETIRRLRDNPKFHNLPIIALTAKAMKDDREKCMLAGASDYIVKPVNTDQLMSLIQVWLYSDQVRR
jgi:signal transduction histidine kinase/DNA-binding response OmpR family regulator/CHASE3 domain sensor protein